MAIYGGIKPQLQREMSDIVHKRHMEGINFT